MAQVYRPQRRAQSSLKVCSKVKGMSLNRQASRQAKRSINHIFFILSLHYLWPVCLCVFVCVYVWSVCTFVCESLYAIHMCVNVFAFPGSTWRAMFCGSGVHI